MKRVPLTALMVFSLTALLSAGAAVPPGDNTRIQVKGVTLTGQLSSTGKVLRADDDNDWNIDNVEAVKGFEGRYVTVNCRMNLGQRAVHVFFVVQPQPKRTPNLSDSAFRR